MSRLAVNVDQIAVIRNMFADIVPDPAHAVVLAELGGAESIVCHLREDLRTVNERDIKIIREIAKTHLNIRSAVNSDTVSKLLKLKPDMITFVASATDLSWEPKPVFIEGQLEALGNYVADLRANDILCSILIEPELNQIKMAGKLEFDYIELNTERYTTADDLDQQIAELETINNAVLAANRLGMGVNASGELNQDNVGDLAKITTIDDLIVGKAILVKALSLGYEQAVRDFINLMNK
jgi:pyridoxine 5-phosphate synthase